MSNLVDWSSIGNQKSGSGNDDLVFLTNKNLPKIFLPSDEILMYDSFFDSDLGRSRQPKADEKARKQYLFYGLFVETDDDGNVTKTIKICNCGTAVVKGIAGVLKTLNNLGVLSFVKATSTGSGLNTEYSVEAVKVGTKDKVIPIDVWDKVKEGEKFKALPSLEEMKNRLLGLTVQQEETDTNESEALEMGESDGDGILDI